MMTTVNVSLAKLPLFKFKEWHKRFMPTDTMTAEERYVSIGGVIPAKNRDKVKPAK